VTTGRRRTAFTLVEAVVVASVTGLVLVVLLMLWRAAASGEARARRGDDGAHEATRLLESLKRDLRSAAAVETTSTSVDLTVERLGDDGRPQDDRIAYRAADDGTWRRTDGGGRSTVFAFGRAGRARLSLVRRSKTAMDCRLVVTDEAGRPVCRLEQTLALGGAVP